eukprot:CAMPEP_0178449704 /NCGR_PEP_ID=MMETSP0689_2-20121128/42709_1 /TAXON_ID=160604 /ORGANISM="Amphidinium massartii, Strain CS-259" /LENGTH=497 /DNA_ID=CAMNT_0020075073 /DNA_START=36 /DNA_END=1529 /DNA_ORIENTATION=-
METLRQRVAEKKDIVMEVLLFDGYELLDVYGPLELLGAGLGSLPGKPGRDCIKLVFTSVEESLTCKPHGGPVTFTDRCFYSAREEPAQPVPDVLFVPGGIGTRSLAKDARFLAKLQERASAASMVLSVCTGSLLLGAAGLLDGRMATTNKAFFSTVADVCPGVKWQRSARWVQDGPFYTSSGVSAGTDMVHSFIKSLLGERTARLIGKLAEYTPNEDPSSDPFAVGTQPPPVKLPQDIALKKRTFQVALIMYDQFEMMDTFGPLEMFGAATRVLQEACGWTQAAFEVTALAEERRVQSFRGPSFQADLLFVEDWDTICAKSFDIVFLPGGIGCLREVHDHLMKQVLQALVPKSELTMTVCSGSTILASTGLLDGKKATSNKFGFHQLALFGPEVDWVQEARWVVDGRFYTSSGVSAGTDLSLHVLRVLFGEELARAVAHRTEYVWSDTADKDPFVKIIPALTWRHKIFTRAVKLLLRVVFGLGFQLGRPMKITGMLV